MRVEVRDFPIGNFRRHKSLVLITESDGIDGIVRGEVRYIILRRE